MPLGQENKNPTQSRAGVGPRARGSGMGREEDKE